MTSEVKGIPIAMFAAYALGVPLAVCRFRNRPSDGAAVGVHYPTGNGDVKTMYMGTRQLKKGCRVLVVDDFMRGGSTASGMLLMAKQFDAEVAGIGIFIASAEPVAKAVPSYRSLLTLRHDKSGVSLEVTR
jgi:purine operon repressor